MYSYPLKIQEMKRIKILCVEDNPGDARLIKELLDDDTLNEYEYTHVESLGKIEKGAEYDVVLLDLSLGDSAGLSTYEGMRTILSETPIIILTGLQDEALAEKIIQKGAQDYLVKDAINTALLTRSVRYAIERNRLTVELEKTKQLENQKREIETLDKIPQNTTSKITERLLGIKSLRESYPDMFMAYSQKLSKILDMVVEAKLYKTDHDITSVLRDFADELGYSFAGPQDVVEIYSYTQKEKIKACNYEAIQIYLEEGRVVILMLMGYLVAFYKKYAPLNMIFSDECQLKQNKNVSK